MNYRHVGRHWTNGFLMPLACIGLAVAAQGPALADPGDTDLVSVTSDGTQAAGDVDSKDENLAVSADGRFVAFLAQDLLPGNVAGGSHVFLRDRAIGTTEQLTAGLNTLSGGAWSVSLSADARFVVFGAPASFLPGHTAADDDIYVLDRESNRMERIGPRGVEANGNSWRGRVSADGRYVAFESFASNLVVGDLNGERDIFLLDRQSGVIERANVSSTGEQPNGDSFWASVSDDGRYVAFLSFASNLVADDTNGHVDVFVRDRLTGRTQRISVGRDGMESVRDSGGAIIGDGRYVVFQSSAWNIVAGDTNRESDVFLWDRQTGAIERVSVGPGGVQANSYSYGASLSADGRYLMFISNATNLVPDDVNGYPDVFVRDRETGSIERVSVNSRGVPSAGYYRVAMLSRDSKVAAFVTNAPGLVPNDLNASDDVYVHEPGGAPVALARFTIKPDALDFGTQLLGSSTTFGFWLRNKGATAFAIESVQIRGVDRAQFKLTNRCGPTVAAGEGCAIRVTFTPMDAGYKTARVRVVAGGQERIVTVQGASIASGS